MTRADLEAAAAERWVEYKASGAVKHHGRAKSHFIAAYVQGRLDQAEADAQIAEEVATETGEGIAEWIATEIQKVVQ